MQAIFPSGEENCLGVDELQTLRFLMLFSCSVNLKNITSKVKACDHNVLKKLASLGYIKQNQGLYAISEKGREEINNITKR